jgi:hypothetical protein
MRPVAKRFLTASVLFLIVPVLLSGCIVCIDDVFNDNRPPRMATLHVYARDYFTGTPIPWAQVELYESDWWSWDYRGTWPMNQAGYVDVRCGYMYYDGRGGPEEEDFRVIVYAPGYSSEGYDIELSYYYPSEMLTFYLMPYMGREAEDTGSGAEIDGGALKGADAAQSRGRVVVGESGTTEGE